MATTSRPASGVAGLLWFDPNGIVDRIPKPLLASQIALRRLNADVPEQELNLLQFSACFVAQTGTRAAKVVGCVHTSEVARAASLLYNAPDHLWAEAVRRSPSRLVDCPKDRTSCDLRCRGPGAQACFDPERNRHRPDVTAFANEIRKKPVLFALLQILNGERCQFCPAQPAAQENGDHCVIPNAAQGLTIKYRKQAPPLFGRKPISDPNSKFLDTFYSTDSGRQVRAEQAGVCGFISEAANGGEAKVDGRRRVTGLFKEDPIASNYGFVERQPRLGTIPLDELPDGMVVRALRTLRGQTIEDGRLGLLQVGQPQNSLGRAPAFVFRHVAILAEARNNPASGPSVFGRFWRRRATMELQTRVGDANLQARRGQTDRYRANATSLL